jgi:NAD(P)-dependent dehydrogenase (short-subunit alcohol dehydrogenase family)
MSARVIITGASGGIGGEAVTQLRAKGATVIGLDLRADEAGDVIACDVRDQASVNQAVSTAIERLGGVDVLINCAGVGDPQSAGTPPDEKALGVIDINMLGPWRVSSAALPALRESRGRVINVASGLAFLTLPFATAYTMSKRAVVAYSDALRIEHGDAITVTTVYPGYIRTPIHDAGTELGLGLEGSVPAENVEDAAGALVRAALGKPVRDLATTRRGTLNYFVLRHVPRRLLDAVIRSQTAKNAEKWAGSPIAGEFAARMRKR